MGWLGDALGAISTGGLSLLPGLSGGGGSSGVPFPTTQTALNSFGPNPYASSLQGMISGMPKFTPVTDTGGTYAAKDMSTAPLPQYDAMRARLASQYSQQQAQGQDAIDRQFAAAGGGPGNGAQAKQTENLAAGIAQAKSADVQNLNAQEAQTRTGLQEQENQRAFESGEASKQRGLQAGEFNAQMGVQQNEFGFDAASKVAGLDMGWRQAQEQASNDAFNQSMAQYQAAHSGGLLGGGGFLGSGL